MAFTPVPRYADPNNINTNLVGINYGSIESILPNMQEAFSNTATSYLGRKFHASADSPQAQEVSNYLYQGDRKAPLTDAETKELYTPTIMSQEQIKTEREGRDGIDLPDSISETIGNQIIAKYDTDTILNFKINHPVSNTAYVTGYVTNFGSSIVLDPVAGVGTSAVLKKGASVLGGKLVTSTAQRIMEDFGINELMGSSKGRFATQIAQSSLHGAASFGTFTAIQESSHLAEQANLGQQPAYLESMKNVAESLALGSFLGAAYGIFKGGVQTKHFANIQKSTFDKISKAFQPYSITTDQIAKMEAMGQYVDGKEPNVDIIHQQGMINESQSFRDQMVNDGVDLEKLSTDMEVTKSNISGEMDALKANELNVESAALEAKRIIEETPELAHDPETLINSIKEKFDLTHEEATSLHDSIREFLPEKPRVEMRVSDKYVYDDLKSKGVSDIEQNETVKAMLRHDQKNNAQQAIIDDPLSTKNQKKEAKKNLAKLKKDIINPLKTIDEELDGLKDKLDSPNFKKSKGYERLKELTKGNAKARDMLAKYNLSDKSILKIIAARLRETRFKDLQDQYNLADMIKKHADGSHEPVTDGQRKGYYDYLKSSGVEGRGEASKVETKSEGSPEEKTKADPIENIDLKETEQLSKLLHDTEAFNDYREIKEEQKKLKVREKVANVIKDCLLGVSA